MADKKKDKGKDKDKDKDKEKGRIKTSLLFTKTTPVGVRSHRCIKEFKGNLMKNLLLRTFVAGGLLVSLPLAAIANEQYDDADYDTAYEACNEVANEQATDDNWQDVFDSCMAGKGFEADRESGDDYQEDTHQEDKSW